MAEIWKRSQSEDDVASGTDEEQVPNEEIVPAGTIDSFETLGRFPLGILTNSKSALFLLLVSNK